MNNIKKMNDADVAKRLNYIIESLKGRGVLAIDDLTIKSIKDDKEKLLFYITNRMFNYYDLHIKFIAEKKINEYTIAAKDFVTDEGVLGNFDGAILGETVIMDKYNDEYDAYIDLLFKFIRTDKFIEKYGENEFIMQMETSIPEKYNDLLKHHEEVYKKVVNATDITFDALLLYKHNGSFSYYLTKHEKYNAITKVTCRYYTDEEFRKDYFNKQQNRLNSDYIYSNTYNEKEGSVVVHCNPKRDIDKLVKEILIDKI